MSWRKWLKSSASASVAATPATAATHAPDWPSTVAGVATVAVAPAANVPALTGEEQARAVEKESNQSSGNTGSDAWCWPHSDAMNGAEVSAFMRRIALLQTRGSNATDAEELAMALLRRDRDGDDRRLCVECSHRHGRQCANYRTAGTRGRALPLDFEWLLQRCDGFREVIHMQSALTVAESSKKLEPGKAVHAGIA